LLVKARALMMRALRAVLLPEIASRLTVKGEEDDDIGE
jgi:hypothetical protein